MIDASDKRLVAWLAELLHRHELIVRLALNARAKNLGPHWDWRVDALKRLCRIDGTAKMAKLPTEVCRQGKVIEERAAGDDQHNG